MEIRAARSEELPALSELIIRSKAHWDFDDAFLEGCRAVLTLRESDLEESSVVVAELDGTAAAMAQVCFDGEEAELDKLFTDPVHIGQGAGRILMQWALDLARSYGARRLMIASDPQAEPFYLLHGARNVGTIESEVEKGRHLPRLQIDL